MRKALIASLFLAVLLAPSLAGAAWLPLVPCGGPNQASCTPCSIFEAFKNIIDLVLYGITGPIAAFMIVYAGGMMLLGGGKPELYSKGKTLLTNTMIGVAIILLSWLVTNFLIKSLMTGGQGDSWYEFSCPVGLSVIKPLEIAVPTGGVLPSLPPGIEMVPEYAGVATLGVGAGSTGINPFCPQAFSCQASYYKGCPQWRPHLAKYSTNAALLESIMFHESSCLIKPKESGKGAYGVLQMKPSTANMNRNGCDITTKDINGNIVPENITQAWLTSEQNLDKILCVANNIVNSLKGGACGSTALGIAAGYNGGPGACAPSRDCSSITSCTGDGTSMRRWECPWDDKFHQIQNTGYRETRVYAPKVAACAK
jgi:hypothetical protein